MGNTGCAHYPGGLAPVLRLNPDAIITGEVDEYPMRAALDMGISMIHVGHARSLTPGLERLAARLRGQFPDLCVVFYENPRPWTAV
ncbi:MAG: Nif3-like dinuclear metal center hexameric protein [Anaerolineae bacterium]|nr:Nif3-like dinuclear metal center hexameric protein [Anaerolineae bacterium]